MNTSSLIKAVLSEDVLKVLLYVREGRDLSQETYAGVSLLHWIFMNKPDIGTVLLDLLEHVPKHKKEGEDEQTLLHIVSLSGHTDAAKILLKQGWDINIKDKRGQTPLMLACKKNQVETVKFFLSLEQCHVNAKTNTDWTALMIAAQMDLPEVIKLLLDSGSNRHMQLYVPEANIHLSARDIASLSDYTNSMDVLDSYMPPSSVIWESFKKK